jgi:thiol:disulfide interchange protein DsbG
MKASRKTRRLTLLCAVFFAVVVFPVFAASPTVSSVPAPVAAVAPTSPASPDPAVNPVLAKVIKSGARVFYLGNVAGLDGWLILKDGQMQVAYVTADKQNVLIGSLFAPGGESVTSDQIEALLSANPDVKNALTGAAHQMIAAAKAGIAASPEALISAPPPAVESPGEQLYKELSDANGVTVGGNTAAPLILMVVDPDCSHCQATWRALRDFVFKNALQIRLVPIGNKNTDGERAAAQLLHAADPLDAWNKYVDGDKTSLAGTPDKSLIEAAQASHQLIVKWKLRETPILVYRAKDGAIKIEQGEPEKISVVLGDLGLPASP